RPEAGRRPRRCLADLEPVAFAEEGPHHAVRFFAEGAARGAPDAGAGEPVLRVEGGEAFRDQPRLAGTGFADERHDLRAAAERPVERTQHLLELVPAADERRGQSGALVAVAGGQRVAEAAHAPDFHRLRLALQRKWR